VAGAGVEAAGVETAGVEAGDGVETGVAAGVGVATGLGVSGGAGGGVGLHERRATAVASASTMEDALFISKEAFLRTGLKSKPVEICIFRFTP